MTVREHADRQAFEIAISEAINEPNGGNYARAIAITRASDRPAGVKEFEIGQLIIGSFVHPGSRRPAETLQQGLDMIEQAAVKPGESRDVAEQQLRMTFERGVGIAPNIIPVDPVVAACWHRLEKGERGDPAQCVALRRQRLPQLSK